MEKIWLSSYDAEEMPHTIDPDQYRSLNEMMDEVFAKFANKPAFESFGTELTFQQIEKLSYQFAAYLQNELGLKKGERLAIMLPNILQYPIAIFGALRIGLIIVNISPISSSEVIEFILQKTTPSAIVIFDNFLFKLAPIIHNHTYLKHIIGANIGDLLGIFKGSFLNLMLRLLKKSPPTTLKKRN